MCPTCGQPSLQKLAAGESCAACASAAAWRELGSSEVLHIQPADIDAAVAKRRGQTRRWWARVPWATLATAAGGALTVAFLWQAWEAKELGPLVTLLDDIEDSARVATWVGLATFVFGVTAVIVGRRKRRTPALPALVALLASIVAGGTGVVGGGLTAWAYSQGFPTRFRTMPVLAEPLLSEHARRALRASAVVLAPDQDGDARNLAFGAGVVIARDEGRAWIITCSHVAMPYMDTGARRDPAAAHPVWVQLADGRQGQGRVRWTAEPPLDVALVEMPVSDAPEPVEIAAESSGLVEGNAVAFSPNPYRDGWLWHRGKILRRDPHTTPAGRYELLHTDLPVVPGDSGSGLFDERGRLIGLNTWAKFTDGTSQGISLPSEAMRAVVEAIAAHDLGNLGNLHQLAPAPRR